MPPVGGVAIVAGIRAALVPLSWEMGALALSRLQPACALPLLAPCS